jgi:hypothetical protein
MPPKELSPEEREQVRREKADMKAEILKLTHVWWKLDMEHSIELAMQLSMFWRELEDAWFTHGHADTAPTSTTTELAPTLRIGIIP